MYLISLWLLRIAFICAAYSLFLMGAIGWPWSGIVAAGLVAAWMTRYRFRHLTTLGSARWADEEELKKAGMLEAESGLILGRIESRSDRFRKFGSLFSLRSGAKEACELFWDSSRRGCQRMVRAARAIHSVVFAPSGVGKGVSCVIPFLQTCEESCVIVDFKGENAKITAEHRRKAFGHRVVLLDPFHVVTTSPDCLNPLDGIKAESPLALDECSDLAKALVVRSAEEKEPHWNDTAETWIASFLATVVRFGEADGLRSLQTMRDLLSHPERMELAIKAMCESDAWGGMLARLGGQLTHFVDREKSSTLSTVSRHLRFLDTPAIAASTKASSFDPALLRGGKMTIYLILPPEHMRAQSALLRMWIGSLLRAIVRGGLSEKQKVHFVLDEASSLGHLESIEDAVDKYRGYGVRLQFYFQSLGQLKKCFPNGQDITLLSNTTQTFFGVNDTATAEMVSSRLGEQTIIVESGGSSYGDSLSRSTGAQPSESSGQSSNTSHNWQQQARKLLKPEEVMALSPRMAITFAPGVLPICTRLLRYYEEPGLGRRTGRFAQWLKSGRILAASLLFCCVSIAFASLITLAILQIAEH